MTQYGHFSPHNSVEERMRRIARSSLVGLIIVVAAGACISTPRAGAASGLEKIEHVVVIYAENRSFDHLYGLFPGANGIARATAEQKTQLDRDDSPLSHL